MDKPRVSRRTALTGMAVAVGATALAACGGATPQAPGPGATASAESTPTTSSESAATPAQAAAGATAVTFMARGDDAIFAVFRKLKDAFAVVHPEITVNILETPGDYLQKLQLMLASGTPPDCDFSNDSDILNLCRKGVYQELDPFLEKDSRFKRDDFYPISLFNGTLRGQALPPPLRWWLLCPVLQQGPAERRWRPLPQ